MTALTCRTWVGCVYTVCGIGIRAPLVYVGCVFGQTTTVEPLLDDHVELVVHYDIIV